MPKREFPKMAEYRDKKYRLLWKWDGMMRLASVELAPQLRLSREMRRRLTRLLGLVPKGSC